MLNRGLHCSAVMPSKRGRDDRPLYGLLHSKGGTPIQPEALDLTPDGATAASGRPFGFWEQGRRPQVTASPVVPQPFRGARL